MALRGGKTGFQAAAGLGCLWCAARFQAAYGFNSIGSLKTGKQPIAALFGFAKAF
nr:hypothetical protein [uncultured Kingella sp.]